MANMNLDYKELAAEETLSLDNSDFEPIQHRASSRPRISTIVLSISTFAFALLSMYLAYEINDLRLATGQASSSYPSREGYKTEWNAPKSAIEFQTVMYTSPLKYNATGGTYYREIDPAAPQYVGEPSPEIDKNWLDLLAGEYLVFNEEEAKELDSPVKIQGYYFGE